MADVAASARLRKLREAEGEGALKGGAYAQRLRTFHAAAARGRTTGVGRDAHDAWVASATAAAAAAAAGGKTDGDDDGSSGEEEGGDTAAHEAALLRTAGGRLAKGAESGAGVPWGKLAVARARDVNRADPAPAVLQALAFHPTNGAVCLTAALDHKLRFFGVDGVRNPRLASVHFDDMPITTAAWMSGGSSVLVTGRRPFYYTYDVESGTATRIPAAGRRDDKSLESAVVQPSDGDGYIAFLCAGGRTEIVAQRTGAWVANLQMAGAVRAVAFTRGLGSAGGTGFDDVLTGGVEGEVYRWDTRTWRAIARHADEGSTGVTALAASPASSTYAVGSTMGIVNMYTPSPALLDGGAAGGSGEVARLFGAASRPKPDVTVSTLTTAISQLAFSHDGSLLATGSQRVAEAFRVVHAPTGKTFGNWPTAKTPLSYVTAAAFSPHSGYLAIGNDRGRALLYRLSHYTEA